MVEANEGDSDMADNLMSGQGDIRRSYGDSGGYGKYGLGDLPFRTTSKKYKCNRICPYKTSKPSCACPRYLLERYMGWYGEFKIIKGEFGDGCPIYTKHVMASHNKKEKKSTI